MPLSVGDVLVAQDMRMPLVGLGTVMMENNESSCGRAVRAAVEAGYRHFDTAFLYNNETSLGEALRGCIEDGLVSREELFVVTKLQSNCMRPKYVEPYLKKSLENLGMDYADLYLIHHPCGYLHDDDAWFQCGLGGKKSWWSEGVDPEADLVSLWKEMEKQVEAGLTKAIGVSNFNIKQLERILANCKIPPANNQVELHIYLQQPELLEFCRSKGITVCAYSPLGSPGSEELLKKCGSEARWWNLLGDPVVVELAAKHKKTAGQVLLRFLLQLGVAVIPKSANPERIKQNIDLFDFELDEYEMDLLRSLDKGEEGRILTFDFVKGDHPERPF